MLEDERELLGTHAGEDDGLGEGVHEELLRVGLQGKELREHCNLIEEQQTVLVIALAAVPQNLQAEVHDFADHDSIELDILLITKQLCTEALHYLDRALDLEHLLVLAPDVLLHYSGVDGVEEVHELVDYALLLEELLHLVVVVGHLPQLVGTRLKAFSEVVAEGEQLNQVLDQQLQYHLFSGIDLERVLLEHPDALPQEGENAHDVVVLPLLDELNFGELEVIFLLELSLWREVGSNLVDLEGLAQG